MWYILHRPFWVKDFKLNCDIYAHCRENDSLSKCGIDPLFSFKESNSGQMHSLKWGAAVKAASCSYVIHLRSPEPNGLASSTGGSRPWTDSSLKYNIKHVTFCHYSLDLDVLYLSTWMKLEWIEVWFTFCTPLNAHEAFFTCYVLQRSSSNIHFYVLIWSVLMLHLLSAKSFPLDFKSRLNM